MDEAWLVKEFLKIFENFFKFRPVGRDWARREAHLELTRRERTGLPLVSSDLIERSRVEASLPSEEELRDFDIII